MNTTCAPKRLSASTLVRRREPSPVAAPDTDDEHGTGSQSRGPRVDGVLVGTVVAVDAVGTPLVDFPGNARGRLAARSLTAVDWGLVGREVVLMFENSDPCAPIIMGLLQDQQAGTAAAGRGAVRELRADPPAVVDVDGDRIALTAEREIVLRCGKASITLTRAGKVLITGEYVLTRAGGVNRIRGGSVQIN